MPLRPGTTNYNVVMFDGVAETVGNTVVTVLERDPDGNVLTCRGTSVPTGAGYAKPGWFLLTSASSGTSGTYENVGTTTSANFQLVASGGGRSFVNSTSVSSAQILAMNSTPVTIVAAPGQGLTTVVRGITVYMSTTSTQYAAGGPLEFRYTDASGAQVTATIASAVVNAAAGSSYTSVAGVTTSLTNVQNAPIVMRNGTAAYTTGTGTATVFTSYDVVGPGV